MSKALTPFPSLDTVTVPVGGDARTAGSVEAPFQALLNRVEYLLARHGALITLSASGLATSGLFTVDGLAVFGAGGYTEPVTNEIEVPEAGWYFAYLEMYGTSNDATNPTLAEALLQVGGAGLVRASAYRWSASTSDVFAMNAGRLLQIATPSSERIRVQLLAGGAFTTSTSNPRLVLVKIGEI